MGKTNGCLKDPKLKKATLKKHLADMYTNTEKLKDRLHIDVAIAMKIKDISRGYCRYYFTQRYRFNDYKKMILIL